ncbi:MAG: carbohydrate kinase family protein [Armatimonadota bacterium]
MIIVPEKSLDIAVIGLSCVDCIATGSDIHWHVMNPVHDMRLSAGGLNNALCALSGLGLEIGISSRIGKDIFGEFLLRYWQDVDVNTAGVVVDPERKTGFSFILDQDNERTPFYSAGANEVFCPDDIPDDLCERSRCLLIFFAGTLPSIDGQPMLELVKRCHETGTAIIMDVSDGTSADYGAIHSYLPYVNLIINSEEARRITGKNSPIDSLKYLDAMAAGDGMFRGVTWKAGVTLSVPEHEGRRYIDIPSPFYGRHVDGVVGAGDAFRAGLAAFICLHYEDFTHGELDYQAAGLFASAVSYLYLSRLCDVRPFNLDDIQQLLIDTI